MAHPRRAVLAAVMILAAAQELSSENVALTTYYPAPSGIYTRMITTEDTFLARDGGSVMVGSTGPSAAKLDVTGSGRYTGAVDGADFRIGGQSTIVRVLCAPDTGLSCSKVGNDLIVTKAVCVPSSCSAAPPPCDGRTSGTDNCGGVCEKVGVRCDPRDPPEPCGGCRYSGGGFMCYQCP